MQAHPGHQALDADARSVGEGPPGQQAGQLGDQVLPSNDWTRKHNLAQLFDGSIEGRQLPRSISRRQVWRLSTMLGSFSQGCELWKALKNSRVEYGH